MTTKLCIYDKSLILKIRQIYELEKTNVLRIIIFCGRSRKSRDFDRRKTPIKVSSVRRIDCIFGNKMKYNS